MGSGFTVVVLDECSQMTEPLCLVPLLRAKARCARASERACAWVWQTRQADPPNASSSLSPAVLTHPTLTIPMFHLGSRARSPLAPAPARALPRFLVAAGDPQQLPPVIASPANLTAPAPQHQPGPASGLQWGPGAVGAAGAGSQRGHPGAATDSLLRPLFVRLCQLGHAPHLLSYQYR